MAKVFRMSIPPELQPLLDKIISYFDQLKYPTWATRFLHKTRSAKKRNREKTYIPAARAVWNSLTPSQKEAWKRSREFTIWQREYVSSRRSFSGYHTFITDYSYRKKNNLSLPGTPSFTHQLFGLKMFNPGGNHDVFCRLHLKDLVGPIKVEFYYKKIEYSPTFGNPFNVIADAFFFDGGLNILDEETWESPAGNINWSKATINVGELGKKYFHLIIQFSLFDYNAAVFIDKLSVSDYYGIFYYDSFIKKSGKAWKYQPFYRKQGWAFYPSFDAPYFEVVYLDS